METHKIGRRRAQLAAIAMIVTVIAAALWVATGRHTFTKYESIEEESFTPAPDDPFAAAGFYDGDAMSRASRVDAFHFGLLPAAGSLFDKHLVSLITVALPFWAVAVVVSMRRHRVTARRIDSVPGRGLPSGCRNC